MTTKVMASTSGIDSATTRPARMPRLMKLTASTMTTASNSARVKPETASSHHLRLVGDQMHADADRQLGQRSRFICSSQRLAEGQQIGARLHADGETDRRLAVEAEQRVGGSV